MEFDLAADNSTFPSASWELLGIACGTGKYTGKSKFKVKQKGLRFASKPLFFIA
jgi:hypothetical protein